MAVVGHLKEDRAWVRALLRTLNGSGHKRAMQVFMVIVLSHWVEHILQAAQIYLLGWPRASARGALGLLFPWLVSSEWLHYAYALAMLIGLAALRPAFVGRDRVWWNIALGLQVWHHFEHALLLVQAATGTYLFSLPAPTSLAQLVVPRVELHLFYNAVVFVPMLIATLHHMYPRRDGPEFVTYECSCARRAMSTMP